MIRSSVDVGASSAPRRSPHFGKRARRLFTVINFWVPGSERGGRFPGQLRALGTHLLPGAGSGPAQGGRRQGPVRGGAAAGDPEGDGEREERQGEEDPRAGEVRGEKKGLCDVSKWQILWSFMVIFPVMLLY